MMPKCNHRLCMFCIHRFATKRELTLLKVEIPTFVLVRELIFVILRIKKTSSYCLMMHSKQIYVFSDKICVVGALQF